MNRVTSLRLLIQEGEKRLGNVGIESPKREAQLLIAAALQKSMTEIFMMDKETLIDPTLIRQYFSRREQHEPFAYIVKEQGFWNLDLEVSPATLIPRADSEALIEVLLELLPEKEKSYRFLDLGTGTGCLLLSALTEYPNAYGVGVDIVSDAAILASENSHRNHLDHRASFITGHWADALKGTFDVILSNPPYIRKKELLELMPEVQKFEPMSALYGGEDGLDAYRYICQQSVSLLSEKAILILELGIKQDHHITEFALPMGLNVVKKQHDLNGFVRALVLSRYKL